MSADQDPQVGRGWTPTPPQGGVGVPRRRMAAIKKWSIEPQGTPPQKLSEGKLKLQPRGIRLSISRQMRHWKEGSRPSRTRQRRLVREGWGPADHRLYEHQRQYPLGAAECTRTPNPSPHPLRRSNACSPHPQPECVYPRASLHHQRENQEATQGSVRKGSL